MPSLLVPYRAFVAVAVAAAGSAESAVMDIGYADRAEAVNFRLASPGVADVKIEYAESSDGETFGAYDDQPPILASSATSWPTTTEGEHTVAMPNPLARYLKLKVTGVGANDAGTVLTFLDLLLREKT